ncbi:DUF4065 domain-containing protein [Lacrimispora saccharolytica]|nr:DUF4065 domain-containing protein [Lacrimispora saccharolytica]
MAGYNVLDVSRYVIDYSNRKEYGISNLKLQKVLYFIQAYFLTNEKNGTPCFRERIEAWDFGPVVPEAYREYRQYGSCNIPTTTSYMDFDVSNIWNSQRRTYAEQKISGGDKRLIDAVVDKFADYSATDLVTLTHKQAPWKKAYVPHMNNEITIESIREYFSAT